MAAENAKHVAKYVGFSPLGSKQASGVRGAAEAAGAAAAAEAAGGRAGGEHECLEVEIKLKVPRGAAPGTEYALLATDKQALSVTLPATIKAGQMQTVTAGLFCVASSPIPEACTFTMSQGLSPPAQAPPLPAAAAPPPPVAPLSRRSSSSSRRAKKKEEEEERRKKAEEEKKKEAVEKQKQEDLVPDSDDEGGREGEGGTQGSKGSGTSDDIAAFYAVQHAICLRAW